MKPLTITLGICALSVGAANAGRCSKPQETRCNESNIAFVIHRNGTVLPSPGHVELPVFRSTKPVAEDEGRGTHSAVPPGLKKVIEFVASSNPTPTVIAIGKDLDPFGQRNKPQALSLVDTVTERGQESNLGSVPATSHEVVDPIHPTVTLEPFAQRNRPISARGASNVDGWLPDIAAQRNKPVGVESSSHAISKRDYKVDADFELCCEESSELCVAYPEHDEFSFCYNPDTYMFHLRNNARGSLRTLQFSYPDGTEGSFDDLDLDFDYYAFTPFARAPVRTVAPAGVTMRPTGGSADKETQFANMTSGAKGGKFKGGAKGFSKLAGVWLGLAAIWGLKRATYSEEEQDVVDLRIMDDATATEKYPKKKKRITRTLQMSHINDSEFFLHNPAPSVMSVGSSPKDGLPPAGLYATGSQWAPVSPQEKLSQYGAKRCELCGHVMPIDGHWEEHHDTNPDVVNLRDFSEKKHGKAFMEYVIMEGWEGFMPPKMQDMEQHKWKFWKCAIGRKRARN